ncbi:MGMT family protein [Hydrogenophaga sp. PAMC20947]|uniref:methylated-DNA--[protein]-cysteine S-methyltransferase n=1 Tax=Hydrogenophaga sp. PAMC20947 TaxID=2565558 RepID=UPI0032B467EE
MLKSAGDCPTLSDVPSLVPQAVQGIQALLRGEPRNLLELPLDMSLLTDFQSRVYAFARAIPPGSTRTYGEVARGLGDVKLARAVGQAMGHNPFAPVVPCHRVLAAGNRPGGFSATGGAATKLRMLAIEGAMRSETLPLFR